MVAFCPGLAFLAVFCPVVFCPYTGVRGADSGGRQHNVDHEVGSYL